MADFSKQWCDIYDPDMPWDFDIEEIAETIPKGHYKPMICEGFGFSGIGVRLNGDIEILVIDRNDEESYIQIEYKKFMELHKSKVQS
jgi:hypothetical protein